MTSNVGTPMMKIGRVLFVKVQFEELIVSGILEVLVAAMTVSLGYLRRKVLLYELSF